MLDLSLPSKYVEFEFNVDTEYHKRNVGSESMIATIEVTNQQILPSTSFLLQYISVQDTLSIGISHQLQTSICSHKAGHPYGFNTPAISSQLHTRNVSVQQTTPAYNAPRTAWTVPSSPTAYLKILRWRIYLAFHRWTSLPNTNSHVYGADENGSSISTTDETPQSRSGKSVDQVDDIFIYDV